MQYRVSQESQGRRRTLRIVGATAACVVALAAACSSPIADQPATPEPPTATSNAATVNNAPTTNPTVAPEPSTTTTSKSTTATSNHTLVRDQQPVNVDQPYFEFQVEKQVRVVPGSPQPHYPATMKKAKISGEVLAQFVVNADGRADLSTFKVLKSDHQEFADAVREILPDMRFIPAEIGGQKVKQMVQQPFTFAISK